MVLVVLGLLLVLTYLLLRGSTPDAALHERRLRAIDALALNQAALHRDVLQASHGLLLNYDPLVAAASRLREVAEELRGAGAASGPLIDSIAAALDEQEALVEDFKSAHALLRNSRAYFAHLSRSLGTSTSQAGQEVAAVVARLATGMLRFAGGFSDDVATAEVAALLDELSVLAAPATLREDIAALRAHGSLILRTLPTVEELLARLLATRISEQARALQDLFIEEHRRAETLAGISRVLLYLASVLLLIYLSHLYVRLRANARTLKARSDFEHLIAGISAQLIDTPVDRTGHGVLQGLERLGRHTGVDRVYVILNRANDAMDGGSHSWCREGIDLPGGWPDGALAIGSTWSSQGYERHGCIDVPAVQAMPRGEEKSRLTERGIRSWLCVPLWYAGNRVGLLGLDAVEAEKRWADDDIALLRTIGEIFASALGRDATLTQRREAFDRLAASEARYRAVVDTQTEFIARITPDGRLSFVSDAYCRYYGRSREDLLGRRFNEFTLTVPEDRERDEAHIASLTRDCPSRTIELRRRLPDGGIRWVQWADTAVFDAQGKLAEIQSVGRDVTDRAAAEARFLAAAETLPAGLAIFDAEDRMVYHNRRYPEHQTENVRAALALGKRFEDLLRDALARGPIHHPDMGEGFVRRRLAMRRLDHSDHEQHLADGRWVRVREARMPDGGLVLLTTDITRERSLEAELRQAEKLKAVGTLASGVAHDFNNILATIFTSTEVALLHLPPDSAARAPLGRVLSAGKRGRQLASEILTFSRSEPTPRAAIDLGAAVASAIDLCRPAMGHRVEVALERPAAPIFVAADETQIHKVVSNLCLNAAQAMPDGGTIAVRVDCVGGPEGAPRARLRVRDLGSGMDADTASRAFEPFFTTKPVGQGTGLGLAVVHGTVQALGGRVKLRTVPGRGSVFAIYLPCVGRVGADALAPTDTFPAGQGRTVLLVEPDDPAAEAVGALLRAAGYRVARFAAPAEALSAFSAQRRAELLVSALDLPALPGLELARAMRLLAPGLGVVLLADAPASAAEVGAAQGLGAPIVGKPVLRRELAAALGAVLRPAGAPGQGTAA